MRLWSIHPSLLDSKGLVAVWREALLAKKVLEGNTKGYKNHPQLNRFKTYPQGDLKAINCYLWEVWWVADKRGYKFDKSKIDMEHLGIYHPMYVNTGQLYYEWEHLLKKVAIRDEVWYNSIRDRSPIAHGLFELRVGPIESWEVISKQKDV